MNQILFGVQIAVSVILVVLVLLQQRGAGLGSIFGGGGEFYASRRGAEKKIFWATIFFGTIFIILALLNLVI